jgi:hypothetical protein
MRPSVRFSNLGPRILRARRLASGLGLSLLLGGLLAPPVPAAVSPTPTPRPRLTGGFGRPRSTTPPVPNDGGQSLADVVRAAREARQPREAPAEGAITITNRSLVTDPDKGRLSTGRPLPTPKRSDPGPSSSAPSGVASGSAAAATGAGGGTPRDSEAPASAADPETHWREASRAARKRVEDAKARVGELDAAAKKLENDFYAWDDGQYRDRVIKPAWDHARERLEDARRELAEAEKELAELPEKARRAGALPGWLRE